MTDAWDGRPENPERLFDAIYNAIRGWDIGDATRSGGRWQATGTDVSIILAAIAPEIAARERAAREKALREAAGWAKTAWLTFTDRDYLGDADAECALCEHAEAVILALIAKEDGR